MLCSKIDNLDLTIKDPSLSTFTNSSPSSSSSTITKKKLRRKLTDAERLEKLNVVPAKKKIKKSFSREQNRKAKEIRKSQISKTNFIPSSDTGSDSTKGKLNSDSITENGEEIMDIKEDVEVAPQISAADEKRLAALFAQSSSRPSLLEMVKHAKRQSLSSMFYQQSTKQRRLSGEERSNVPLSSQSEKQFEEDKLALFKPKRQESIDGILNPRTSSHQSPKNKYQQKRLSDEERLKKLFSQQTTKRSVLETFAPAKEQPVSSMLYQPLTKQHRLSDEERLNAVLSSQVEEELKVDKLVVFKPKREETVEEMLNPRTPAYQPLKSNYERKRLSDEERLKKLLSTLPPKKSVLETFAPAKKQSVSSMFYQPSTKQHRLSDEERLDALLSSQSGGELVVDKLAVFKPKRKETVEEMLNTRVSSYRPRKSNYQRKRLSDEERLEKLFSQPTAKKSVLETFAPAKQQSVSSMFYQPSVKQYRLSDEERLNALLSSQAKEELKVDKLPIFKPKREETIEEVLNPRSRSYQPPKSNYQRKRLSDEERLEKLFSQPTAKKSVLETFAPAKQKSVSSMFYQPSAKQHRLSDEERLNALLSSKAEEELKVDKLAIFKPKKEETIEEMFNPRVSSYQPSKSNYQRKRISDEQRLEKLFSTSLSAKKSVLETFAPVKQQPVSSMFYQQSTKQLRLSDEERLNALLSSQAEDLKVPVDKLVVFKSKEEETIEEMLIPRTHSYQPPKSNYQRKRLSDEERLERLFSQPTAKKSILEAFAPAKEQSLSSMFYQPSTKQRRLSDGERLSTLLSSQSKEQPEVDNLAIFKPKRQETLEEIFSCRTPTYQPSKSNYQRKYLSDEERLAKMLSQPTTRKSVLETFAEAKQQSLNSMFCQPSTKKHRMGDEERLNILFSSEEKEKEKKTENPSTLQKELFKLQQKREATPKISFLQPPPSYEHAMSTAPTSEDEHLSSSDMETSQKEAQLMDSIVSSDPTSKSLLQLVKEKQQRNESEKTSKKNKRNRDKLKHQNSLGHVNMSSLRGAIVIKGA